MDYTTKQQLNTTGTITVYRYYNKITKTYGSGCWSRLSSMRPLFDPDKDQYEIHKCVFKQDTLEVVKK